MTSAIVLVSLAFGIGVLLIFDGLTRERLGAIGSTLQIGSTPHLGRY